MIWASSLSQLETRPPTWGWRPKPPRTLGRKVYKSKILIRGMERPLTIDETAEFLGFPRSMISEAIADGSLKAIKHGNNFIRLRRETLEKWLADLETH